MECSPCDKSTKIPNAGVGMAVDKNITFMRAEKNVKPSSGHTKQEGSINILSTLVGSKVCSASLFIATLETQQRRKRIRKQSRVLLKRRWGRIAICQR